MYLQALTVENVRNLHSQHLKFIAQQNLFVGPNGSGKTSLLEAVHLLCVSRSFRTHQIERVITRNTTQLRVTGIVSDPDSERQIRIGLARAKGVQELHVNQRRVSRLSELTQICPVVVINPEAHQLLEQGPKQRRQFLDWGLFHVEPMFLSIWQEFYRVLRQRNSALRGSKSPGVVAAWDPEYRKAAENLHRLRSGYIETIQERLAHFTRLLLGEEARFSYRPGWHRNQDLQTALAAQSQTDRERGFTHSGPHRADLIVEVGGERAQDYLSRGQQKLMVCAMRLAQAAELKARGKDSLVLMDDLPSELDKLRRQRLMDALAELGLQSFITATDAAALPFNDVPTQVFHVEQGLVQT